MDQERFDRLTRTLATGQSRRGLLKGLTGTALGGVLAAAGLRGTGLAAPPAKMTICHWDAKLATYQQLSVPARDLKGHARHTRDIIAPDFVTSPQTCGSCTNACAAPPNATATCTSGTCGFDCATGYQLNANGDACKPVPVTPTVEPSTDPAVSLVFTRTPSGGACNATVTITNFADGVYAIYGLGRAVTVNTGWTMTSAGGVGTFSIGTFGSGTYGVAVGGIDAYGAC